VFYSGATTFQGLDQVNFYVPSASQVGTCEVGMKLDLSMDMKSTVSGVASNTIVLPVVTSGC